jgi:hypothetical protein
MANREIRDYPDFTGASNEGYLIVGGIEGVEGGKKLLSDIKLQTDEETIINDNGVLKLNILEGGGLGFDKPSTKLQVLTNGSAGVTINNKGQLIANCGHGVKADTSGIEIDGDNNSIDINTDNKIQIYGFEDAQANQIPIKISNEIQWVNIPNGVPELAANHDDVGKVLMIQQNGNTDEVVWSNKMTELEQRIAYLETLNGISNPTVNNFNPTVNGFSPTIKE